MVRSTKLSTLYTLIIRPDGSFDVLVNREKARSGSLYSDFDPPLNTPTEMDDPDDFKPSDWVDQAKYARLLLLVLNVSNQLILLEFLIQLQ